MSILEDLLSEELTESNLKITVQQQYDTLLNRSITMGGDRLRSPKPAKSLRETYTLIKQAIDNYQTRANTPNVNKIIFTEEEPDKEIRQELITFSLVKRTPGSISQGSPMEGNVHNLKPLFRDEIEDTKNPGFRVISYGYIHDNIVRFTCWAQTNKAANARAEWLENLLEEYAWFFKAEGVDRFIYFEQQADVSVEINGNKWYGRPLDYYIRTETIHAVKEKSIEEIIISFSTDLDPL